MSPMTRSRVPFGTSSASPPVRFTKSRTHSAARRRSSWCAGSALTEGMETNSRSSSSQDRSTSGESTCPIASSASGDVAKLDRVRERPELFQALVLDLPDALAGDVERPPHFVERPRMLAVEAVAQLEDLALAARERPEDLPQRLLAERDLGLLVGKRQVLVRDEVSELGLVLVADRLLERDGRLRAAADVLDLVGA